MHTAQLIIASWTHSCNHHIDQEIEHSIIIPKRNSVFNSWEERLKQQIHLVYLGSYSIHWDLDWAVWVKFKYEWVSTFKYDSTESRDKNTPWKMCEAPSTQLATGLFHCVTGQTVRTNDLSVFESQNPSQTLDSSLGSFLPLCFLLLPRCSVMKCMWPGKPNRASLFQESKTDN